MPAVTRKGDRCSGHDACSSVSLVGGSSNVFINGQPAGRVNDQYQSHGCLVHGSHQDTIASGSSTVFVNDRSLSRVGDSVVLSGSVVGGSPNVFAN